MYMANTIKGVISYANVIIHLKQQFYNLKNVPNAQIVYVLLYGMSYIHTKSYIAILQGVNLPHPRLTIRGST